ncbi:hypothetical protein FOL47_000983 [Perkinsus chesapeaki]|uniref:Uncharacterized protein n=1 Tax=Perkinsus chesapeaki TaxID=330153 RepID=A0A7J6MKF9_PERCH|nr:hypothetical protein FOL47_000983 [Perkinsus chesapeaki]
MPSTATAAAKEKVVEGELPPSGALSARYWSKYRHSRNSRKPCKINIKTDDPPADHKGLKAFAYRENEARNLGKPEYTVVEGVTSVQVFSKIPNFTDFTAELVQIQPGFSVPTERYALGDIFVIVLDCADGELECLMGKDTKSVDGELDDGATVLWQNPLQSACNVGHSARHPI